MIRKGGILDAAAIHGMMGAAKDDIPIKNDKFGTDVGMTEVEKWCAAGRVWVAEEDDDVVAGVAVLDGVEIRYVVTVERYRRTGVACELVEAVAKHIRDRGYQPEIQVRPGNVAMGRLIEAMGFVRLPEPSEPVDEFVRYTRPPDVNQA